MKEDDRKGIKNNTCHLSLSLSLSLTYSWINKPEEYSTVNSIQPFLVQSSNYNL